MRLIDLRPTPHERDSPFAVMALGDSDVCYHYRATREHEPSEHSEGIDIVFASERVANRTLSSGLTVESLLAICEDRAKHLHVGSPAYRLVALQLQAARRALATDESDKVNNLVNTGIDSERPTHVDATTLS